MAILGIHAVKAWAWSPSPKCQAAANAFCLSSCVPKVVANRNHISSHPLLNQRSWGSRMIPWQVHVNSTLARYSGPPPEMWRCVLCLTLLSGLILLRKLRI